MKVKGKHVILSFVCLVLGFMISFSYQFTKTEVAKGKPTERQWTKEFEYRNQIIEQEEKTVYSNKSYTKNKKMYVKLKKN